MVVTSYGVVIEKAEQRTSIAFAEDSVISFERASRVAKEAHEIIYDATSREAVDSIITRLCNRVVYRRDLRSRTKNDYKAVGEVIIKVLSEDKT